MNGKVPCWFVSDLFSELQVIVSWSITLPLNFWKKDIHRKLS